MIGSEREVEACGSAGEVGHKFENVVVGWYLSFALDWYSGNVSGLYKHVGMASDGMTSSSSTVMYC